MEEAEIKKIMNHLLGMFYYDAVDYLTIKKVRYRTASLNGKSYLLTMDFVDDRLNLEVKDDTVVMVTRG